MGENDFDVRVPDLRSKSHRGQFGKVSYYVQPTNKKTSINISPKNEQDESFVSQSGPLSPINESPHSKSGLGFIFASVSRDKRKQIKEGVCDSPGVGAYFPKLGIIQKRRPQAMIFEEKKPVLTRKPSPVCRKLINLLNQSEEPRKGQSYMSAQRHSPRIGPVRSEISRKLTNKSFDITNLRSNDNTFITNSIEEDLLQPRFEEESVSPHCSPRTGAQTRICSGVCSRAKIVHTENLVPERSSYYFPHHVLYNRHGKLNCESTNIIEKVRSHLGIFNFAKLRGRKQGLNGFKKRGSFNRFPPLLLSQYNNASARSSRLGHLDFDKQVGRSDSLLPEGKIPTVLCYDWKKLDSTKGTKLVVSIDKMTERLSSKVENTVGPIPSPESAERALKHISHFKKILPPPNMSKSPGRDNKMYELLERDRMDKFKYSIQAKLAILEVKNKLKAKRMGYPIEFITSKQINTILD